MFSLVALAGFAMMPSFSTAQDTEQQAVINPADLADQATEKSTLEKASFLFGYNLVLNLKEQGIEVDPEQVAEGVRKALADEPIGMEAEEIQSVMVALQKIAMRRQQEIRQEQAAKNLAEGEKFMAEFAQMEGVQQLEDGILFKSLTKGEGPQPKPTDRVRIHYEGKFPNGQVFDSSLNGDPLELGVSDFVEGFSKALQGMHVGDKWMVAIRGDRAYGMNPPPGFELNKTIVFQIELLEIVKKNEGDSDK